MTPEQTPTILQQKMIPIHYCITHFAPLNNESHCNYTLNLPWPSKCCSSRSLEVFTPLFWALSINFTVTHPCNFSCDSETKKWSKGFNGSLLRSIYFAGSFTNCSSSIMNLVNHWSITASISLLMIQKDLIIALPTHLTRVWPTTLKECVVIMSCFLQISMAWFPVSCAFATLKPSFTLHLRESCACLNATCPQATFIYLI